jgi:hypothetical protein
MALIRDSDVSRPENLTMGVVARIKVPQENIQITPIFLVSGEPGVISSNAAISYITACCQALSAEGISQVDVSWPLTFAAHG